MAEQPAAPQISLSQMVPLGVSLLVSKVDFEELGYRHHVEIAYGVVQVICLGLLGVLYTKIEALPDGGTKIKVPEVKQMGQVVTPALEQTPKEYDRTKFQAQLKQVLMGVVILTGIYYKWQYLFPLVMQVVMSPMQIVESPLFKMHVFGWEQQRPFPEPNPFGLPAAPEAPAEGEGEKKDDEKKAVDDEKKAEESEEEEDEPAKTSEAKKDE
eukprot:TRINITY_DN14790_c1_g1_i1.p2 TRINITY_DN14790_c1_g1~~TRINITY_DN14790_c1_g1_i1.p2  ORF type:complete len:212 (-),score=58.98 TRINITY_DN14790_c1_g1_i1:173-808(-)